MGSPKHFKISEQVLSQEMEGQLVLFSLERERYYALDAVGARMWKLIQEVGDVAEMERRLIQEYEVDAATLRRDLSDLLDRLLDADLVQEDPTCSGAG